MAKRKTLPKDFEEMLRSASLDDLIAVYDNRLLEAYGGYSKNTALGFVDCPDELIRWLAEHGLDVDASDTYARSPLWERASYGRTAQMPLLVELGADIEKPDLYGATPLHAAAGHQKPEGVRWLIDHGANVHATNDEGMTPLEWGLMRTSNIDIVEMAEVASLLLAAGAEVTADVREFTAGIGEEFEFIRADYNPDEVDATAAGLARLTSLIGISPATPRVEHDGVSPIEMPAGDWREQHDALWAFLVPGMGAAKTVQGEAIRVSGRIAHELLHNGGANWDRAFRAMLRAFPGYLSQGEPLSAAECDEAVFLAGELGRDTGDDAQIGRLCELAVAWVALNPAPIPLEGAASKR